MSVALVCLLAVGVYLACGACGVHELACVCGLSACSSGVRVCIMDRLTIGTMVRGSPEEHLATRDVPISATRSASAAVTNEHTDMCMCMHMYMYM